MRKNLLVTGGAGFIGSALVRLLIKETDYTVINIDKLTYAGNLNSLKDVIKNERHIFKQTDILNSEAITAIFNEYLPVGIIHLAAESHVDRSIIGADPFIQTNIVGTYTLLNCAKNYYNNLFNKNNFKFIHVSTDEVFGALGDTGYFNEKTPYDPRSPYSSSKASSDLLAKAWFHTYNLPVIITNCTNNYGPYHFPEKLIPLVIDNALNLRNIPVYGNGTNVRDWLYVEDHAKGLLLTLEKGIAGESYCIGGDNEQSNLNCVKIICSILDELKPLADFKHYADLITFVTDRQGHDYRYAMDSGKIQKELGWKPEYNFMSGIRQTVIWYLENQQWVNTAKSGEYQDWLNTNYANRK